MGLEVIAIPTPYERLADRPFVLEWELAADDGSAYGAAEDTSDVTAARVTAELQVARGETAPAATVWTLAGGEVTIETATSEWDGLTVKVLTVTETTGLDAGTYTIIASLTRGGTTDFVLTATLDLTEQP